MQINKKFYRILIPVFLFSILSCSEEDDVNPSDDRDVFIGTWNVSETCIRDSYSVEIVADPSNSAQVLINNFWLIGFQEKAPYAIVAGNSIIIPKQYICNNNENEVNGTGIFDKNKINLTYTVNDGADLYTCEAEYLKP